MQKYGDLALISCVLLFTVKCCDILNCYFHTSFHKAGYFDNKMKNWLGSQLTEIYLGGITFCPEPRYPVVFLAVLHVLKKREILLLKKRNKKIQIMSPCITNLLPRTFTFQNPTINFYLQKLLSITNTHTFICATSKIRGKVAGKFYIRLHGYINNR